MIESFFPLLQIPFALFQSVLQLSVALNITFFFVASFFSTSQDDERTFLQDLRLSINKSKDSIVSGRFSTLVEPEKNRHISELNLLEDRTNRSENLIKRLSWSFNTFLFGWFRYLALSCAFFAFVTLITMTLKNEQNISITLAIIGCLSLCPLMFCIVYFEYRFWSERRRISRERQAINKALETIATNLANLPRSGLAANQAM